MRVKLQRLIIGLLIGGMLICPVLATSTFPDVGEDALYAEAVEYINETGIMVGDENGNFNPNKTLTRAEIATILCRVLQETENLAVTSVFSDVPSNHWANRYIGRAAELGIVSGYGDGKYGPSDDLTYEQAITMIVRTIYGNAEGEAAGGYPDGFLSIASENGLLNNVFTNKGESILRSDVATILFNYYNISVSG